MNQSRETSQSDANPGWLTLQMARFAGLLFAPTRTLPKLALEAKPLVPLVILIVAMVGMGLTMLPDLQETYRSDELRELYSKHPEEGERVIEIMNRSLPLAVIFQAPLSVMLGVAGVAFLVYLIGRLTQERKLPFKVHFSLVAWASLVGAVPLLLNIPLHLLNPNLLLPTNPAILLSSLMEHGYFFRVLASLDLFLLWQAWLLSVGFAGIYGISRFQAVRIIGTMYVVFIVMNALFAGGGG